MTLLNSPSLEAWLVMFVLSNLFLHLNATSVLGTHYTNSKWGEKPTSMNLTEFDRAQPVYK